MYVGVIACQYHISVVFGGTVYSIVINRGRLLTNEKIMTIF